MDLQIQKVKELREEYYTLCRLVDRLHQQLDKEVDSLQKQCPHEEYYREDDGDYHSSGYYYTCKVCGYFTRYKPPCNCKITQR